MQFVAAAFVMLSNDCRSPLFGQKLILNLNQVFLQAVQHRPRTMLSRQTQVLAAKLRPSRIDQILAKWAVAGSQYRITTECNVLNVLC